MQRRQTSDRGLIKSPLLVVEAAERETLVIPAARPRERRERPAAGLRRRLPVIVSAALALVTLSGAVFLVSWTPASGAAGAGGHQQGATAHTPTAAAKEALRVVGNGAIAPTATPSPTPIPTATPVPTIATTAAELCTDAQQFVPNIGEWTVPPGCYATIYSPNTADYPYRPGFGYCNWWVRERHLNHPDITENTTLPRGDTPVAGAVVWFDPNVQGATSAGHWAQVVAVAPDGYWFLVSEMNFGWRGGGFGKVDYRYAHTGPGVQFVYA